MIRAFLTIQIVILNRKIADIKSACDFHHGLCLFRLWYPKRQCFRNLIYIIGFANPVILKILMSLSLNLFYMLLVLSENYRKLPLGNPV